MTEAIAWQATTRPISPAALITVTITVLSTRQATATLASIIAVPWSPEVSNHRANGPEATAIVIIDTTANREARCQVVARNRFRPARSLPNSGDSLMVAA